MAEEDQFRLDLSEDNLPQDEDETMPPAQAEPANNQEFPVFLSPIRPDHDEEIELPDSDPSEEHGEEAFAAPARKSTQPMPVSQQVDW